MCPCVAYSKLGYFWANSDGHLSGNFHANLVTPLTQSLQQWPPELQQSGQLVQPGWTGYGNQGGGRP